MTPLEKSIRHWQEIVAATKPRDARVGGAYCALCATHQSCIGCPIAKFTGMSQCDGTPYESVVVAKLDWTYELIAPDEFRLAAQRELDFLIALHEGDEEKADLLCKEALESTHHLEDLEQQ